MKKKRVNRRIDRENDKGRREEQAIEEVRKEVMK